MTEASITTPPPLPKSQLIRFVQARPPYTKYTYADSTSNQSGHESKHVISTVHARRGALRKPAIVSSVARFYLKSKQCANESERMLFSKRMPQLFLG